ncbi:MAG: hypothetical protein IJ538_00010 [Clostridia bacterium]|nr:hypothetical protein [Clostridia bacterium]
MNVLNLLAANDISNVANKAYEVFYRIVNIVMPILLAALVLIGMFYGIRLGIEYAKADDDEKKKTAKGKLINVIVGFLIAVVFVAVIYIILNTGMIKNLFNTLSGATDASQIG